jgi:hypothetical protein
MMMSTQETEVPVEAVPTVVAPATSACPACGEVSNELGDSPTQVRDLFIKEVNSMIRYLMSSGVTIPAHVFSVAESFSVEHKQREVDRARLKSNYVFDKNSALDIQVLSEVHDLLSTAIAPSTPRAVLLLDPVFAQKSIFNWLSVVPLLRHLMLVASFSLVVFIGLALSPDISATGGDIFNSDGIPLLVNLLFFVAAAALGACFSALFQANEYIVAGVFDPKFETSYWIRLLVGLMAGLILASLIPIDPKTLNGLGKPTLALLGGFSASLVHRILNLMVGAVEGVVKKMAGAMLDAPVMDTAKKDAESKKAMESMVKNSIESAMQQKQDVKK